MSARTTGWRTLVDAPKGAAAEQRSHADLPPLNCPHHSQPVVHSQAILQRLLLIAHATLQRMAQPGTCTPILCQRQSPHVLQPSGQGARLQVVWTLQPLLGPGLLLTSDVVISKPGAACNPLLRMLTGSWGCLHKHIGSKDTSTTEHTQCQNYGGTPS